MRCKACNVLLEDHELKRKDRMSGEFLDLCDECLHESNEAIYQQDMDYHDSVAVQTELAL